MAGLLLLLPLIAAAQVADPVLVVVDASDPGSARLARELRLAGLDVHSTAMPAGYAGLSLRDQLDELPSHPSDDQAVVWLGRGPDGALDVSIAFVSQSRAVVRVVKAPADAPDPVVSLAVLVREILSTGSADRQAFSDVVDPPEPPPVVEPVEPDVVWIVQGLVGLDGPISQLGSGPWLGGDLETLVELGPRRAAVGASAGLRLAPGAGARGVFRVTGRLGPALLAAGTDVTALPWATLVQPRLELGGTARLPSGLLGELRLRLSPLRDRIERGEQVLYDSGRVELGLYLGAARQIRGDRRQEAL